MARANVVDPRYLMCRRRGGACCYGHRIVGSLKSLTLRLFQLVFLALFTAKLTRVVNRETYLVRMDVNFNLRAHCYS